LIHFYKRFEYKMGDCENNCGYFNLTQNKYIVCPQYLNTTNEYPFDDPWATIVGVMFVI